jgi:hypothetical protein
VKGSPLPETCHVLRGRPRRRPYEERRREKEGSQVKQGQPTRYGRLRKRGATNCTI